MAAPSDKAEIGSQLLFGDYIIIIDNTEDGKWTKVKNAYDGYEGWIDPKQYKTINIYFIFFISFITTYFHIFFIIWIKIIK